MDKQGWWYSACIKTPWRQLFCPLQRVVIFLQMRTNNHQKAVFSREAVFFAGSQLKQLTPFSTMVKFFICTPKTSQAQYSHPVFTSKLCTSPNKPPLACIHLCIKQSFIHKCIPVYKGISFFKFHLHTLSNFCFKISTLPLGYPFIISNVSGPNAATNRCR